MSIHIARKLKMSPGLTLEEYQAVLNVMTPESRARELENFHLLFGPAQWNAMPPEMREDFRAKGSELAAAVAADQA
ncbi:hypothetical protein [Variovorax sp. PBS-H4]|uniref:hypothetical protein n=1 Tax=Variovorax sp. PBS-H4 TaxID=434008 RepID=UPI0013A547E8|nr:hypothetical protein [Variovorax sp. PBS-H4]